MNYFSALQFAETLPFGDAFLKDLQDNLNNKIIFVDDGSIYSIFYQTNLKKCGADFTVKSLEEVVHTVETGEKTDHIIFLPHFAVRIINANFNRTLNKEFGRPYLVFLESNRANQIKEYFETAYKKCIFNAALEFPHLLKAILLDDNFITWMNQDSILEPHNDRTERLMVQSELENQNIMVSNIYCSNSGAAAASLETQLFNKIKKTDPLIYSQRPAHRVYKKYLNIDLPINLNERKIYGEAHL